MSPIRGGLDEERRPSSGLASGRPGATAGEGTAGSAKPPVASTKTPPRRFPVEIHARRGWLHGSSAIRTRSGASAALLLLATPLAACGDEASRGRALADNVARDFGKQCESAPAPNPAARRDHAALCACTEARIAATPMRFDDGDAAIGEKVRAASKACLDALGSGQARRAG